MSLNENNSNHYTSSSGDDDEQMARDMQLAFDLQAKEEQRASKRKYGKKRGSHSNEFLEDVGFSPETLNADHMLFVPCFIDGSEVELLVDTGASSSAISTDMVAKLGLGPKLNTSIFGNAQGVGSSNIVGVVENVECMIDQVEFRLFFMVLEGHMPYCILGLDQMRRFKCQVDLENNVLIFGGKDGVSVPFLSKEEARIAAYKMIYSSQVGERSNNSTSPRPAAQQTPSSMSGMLKSLFRKG